MNVHTKFLHGCPSIFHADVDGIVHPLVLAFLPNKSERIYLRFFTLLKDAIRDQQSVFNLETDIRCWG